MSRGLCWNCGAELAPSHYGRADSCPKCSKDTRSCRNCEHHDRAYNNECRENQAERVVEKERGNFCDYFVPAARGGSSSALDKAAEAKKAAEALFKSKKST